MCRGLRGMPHTQWAAATAGLPTVRRHKGPLDAPPAVQPCCPAWRTRWAWTCCRATPWLYIGWKIRVCSIKVMDWQRSSSIELARVLLLLASAGVRLGREGGCDQLPEAMQTKW